MPTVELTHDQQAALRTRDISVALSAGAGCGKTFVLTNRFLSHLKPEDEGEVAAGLHQLVAITFTDAAAREMRARIRKACYERLTEASSAEEQEHWLRLMREIDAARVSTIHSFCAALLRSNAAAADLDPLFGVLEQGDADVLQLDVIDSVLRDRLARLDGPTLTLASAYGIGRLKQQISELLGRRHDPAFKEWLDASADEMIEKWQTWHATEAFPLALRKIAEDAPLQEILELLRNVTPTSKKEKFVEARATLLELLPKLQRGEVLAEELDLIRESAKVGGVCTAKDWSRPEDYQAYRTACKALRDVIDKNKPKPFHPEAARATAQLGLDLLHLTNDVVELYSRRKAAQAKLDFDDLLATAYRFIADPKHAAIREQLADDLKLLLVDEFQDTDRLQAQLVKALCGNGLEIGRLFFVGDFKQSIYRFRGADPSVFHALRSEIKEQGRLPLSDNFRSQPGILDFVNALFHDTLSTEHEEYQALRPKRDPISSAPLVEFLWTIVPEKKSVIKGAARAARQKEAQAIARRLRALLHRQDDPLMVFDKATQTSRPLQLGDIAILFRAFSDVQDYEEALRQQELDYYLVGGHAFFAQQEIYDVLNLLRAVASTADEVSLAGVLRSPFFALEDETLFWLVDSAGSLNAGLFASRLPPQLSNEEQARVVAAAATIGHLRAIKDRVAIAELLGEALNRTGYDAVLLAEFLGQRKLANLHKLLERARAADAGGVMDLDGFITQLAQFIVQQPKEALAATLPEAANVIRLMTIHHAKGLEFPLVVIPDLDRAPQFRAPPAALHPEFGPLVPAPSDDEEQRNVATGMSLFAAIEKIEESEERKRLLYVACTRAADYLILSSSLEDFSKPKSDWMKLLGERFDLQTGKFLADLPQSYAAPRVHSAPDSDSDHKPAAQSRGPDLLKMLDEVSALVAKGNAIEPAQVAPIPLDLTARQQFSFSRLTGQFIRREHEEMSESDGQSAALAPAREAATPMLDARSLGTLVHDVLARADLNDRADIAAWCEHLASQHVVSNEEDAASIASDLVERFADSPRGKQLASGDVVYHEVEFMLAWPPGSTDSSSAAPRMYLRGFIDSLHQDSAGRWRVLDYKTDNIPSSDVSRRAERYALQLYVYAMAVERSLGRPPTELVLYFLRPGIEHVFAWNDSVRNQAVELVNQAIAAARTENAAEKKAPD